ncbi:MAG: Uma2 family endonuclease [Limnothrix sp. RL_2_0]|nr:Uma2 family endonuclease [Limnothrix sp. RL_2_0]
MVATPLSTAPQQHILLSDISWETYQALVHDLAERPSQRLTYDQGHLEIMTPRPEHEANKRLLGRIVESTTEELGIEIYSLGSTTWSREDLQKGLEPDECYYITAEPEMRGKIDIDLAVDPAPDLAIEIDITSSSLNRLAIYASLGIPEIWRFAGNDLFIYVLMDGGYQTQEQSRLLPMLNRSKILEVLSRKAAMGENAVIREFRLWLRAQL